MRQIFFLIMFTVATLTAQEVKDTSKNVNTVEQKKEVPTDKSHEEKESCCVEIKVLAESFKPKDKPLTNAEKQKAKLDELVKYELIETEAAYKAIGGKYTNLIEYKNGFSYIYFRDSTDKLYLYVAPAKYNVVQSFYYRGFGVGIMTVPIKFRAGTKQYPAVSETGLTNVVITPGYYWNLDNYKYTGIKVNHKFGVSAVLGPNVIALTPDNSKVTKNISRCYLTAGVAISYTFNEKVSFSLIPIGFDLAISDKSKKFFYDGTYWSGFGVGIDTSIFGWLRK